MSLLWSCRSDAGPVRSANEDSCAVDAELGLFLVADGMGGHAGGAQASQLAVQAVARLMATEPPPPEAALPGDLPPGGERLFAAARMANREIYETALADPDLEGMGSTLVGLLLQGGIAYVVHVGDSRCLRLRGEALQLLTRDHSLVNELIDLGELDPADAFGHPDSNVLTSALGADADVTPALGVHPVEEGDLYLLCSDGLSDVVPEAALRELLAPMWSAALAQVERAEARQAALDRAAADLVRFAIERGSEDNITVLLVKVDGLPG